MKRISMDVENEVEELSTAGSNMSSTQSNQNGANDSVNTLSLLPLKWKGSVSFSIQVSFLYFISSFTCWLAWHLTCYFLTLWSYHTDSIIHSLWINCPLELWHLLNFNYWRVTYFLMRCNKKILKQRVNFLHFSVFQFIRVPAGMPWCVWVCLGAAHSHCCPMWCSLTFCYLTVTSRSPTSHWNQTPQTCISHMNQTTASVAM